MARRPPRRPRADRLHQASNEVADPCVQRADARRLPEFWISHPRGATTARPRRVTVRCTMMHPVGSKPPAVYWRRRAVLLITVVLLVVSLYVLFGRGAGRPGASALAPTSTPSTSAANHPTSTTAARTAAPSTTGSNSCPGGTLKLAATTAAPSFKLGSQPVLALQVTNTGTKAASPTCRTLNERWFTTVNPGSGEPRRQVEPNAADDVESPRAVQDRSPDRVVLPTTKSTRQLVGAVPAPCTPSCPVSKARLPRSA